MTDWRETLTAGVRGEILLDEPLSRHTSLKVGGPADLFVSPLDVDELARLIAAAESHNVPWLVIGGGFNLLVRDGGWRGLVVSLGNLSMLEPDNNGRVLAQAGVGIGRLVSFTVEHGLAGLEFMAAIPGTVGGAVAMNAGAHGEAILERAESLMTLREGMLMTTRREDLDYGYRRLTLHPGEIIVSALFRLEHRDRAVVENRISEYRSHRQTAQPVKYPSAGSFFRNPPGEAAWRLIDRAGMRGRRIGGAEVSEAHANFLVNRGGAKARDFLDLATLVKDRVREVTGIEIQEEVRVVGENATITNTERSS